MWRCQVLVRIENATVMRSSLSCSNQYDDSTSSNSRVIRMQTCLPGSLTIPLSAFQSHAEWTVHHLKALQSERLIMRLHFCILGERLPVQFEAPTWALWQQQLPFCHSQRG